MTATPLDILMILSLGILAGTGTGLFIGFIAGKQKPDFTAMEKKDIAINALLILVCSAIFCAVLAWYLFVYLAK
jgi:hypothetical protein